MFFHTGYAILYELRFLFAKIESTHTFIYFARLRSVRCSLNKTEKTPALPANKLTRHCSGSALEAFFFFFFFAVFDKLLLYSIFWAMCEEQSFFLFVHTIDDSCLLTDGELPQVKLRRPFYILFTGWLYICTYTYIHVKEVVYELLISTCLRTI